MESKSKFIIISLGGSLIVPHLSDEGGIDVEFLKKFRDFVLAQIKYGRKFIIIAGGGHTNRVYNRAASQIAKPSSDDLDWVGIAATKLNAQLILTIFRGVAYPEIIDHSPLPKEIEQMKSDRRKIYIGCGWHPGQSTDHVAVSLAQKFGAKEVINASNVSFVFDKDPAKFNNAKAIKNISWKDYRKLIPAEWIPRLSSPFDPVAARFAEKHNIRVKIMKGTDLQNFKNAVERKEFQGTLIGEEE